VYFVAKKELKRIPFLGWGMWAVGMIFVDRSNREKSRISLKKAGEKIKRGKSIVTFPEGTRSETTQMLPFKKGAFHLAKEGRITIVPLAISGTEKILPPGGKIKGGRIRVKVGEPIPVETIDQLSIQELSALSRDRIREMLDEMENAQVKQKMKIA
jgi:1-acyl-sn-glycerol-3-phosphate acyltransferase